MNTEKTSENIFMYNLGKPSITQIIQSRNTGKFVYMRPPNFGDTEMKQEIAVNPLSRIIFHFRKP